MEVESEFCILLMVEGMYFQPLLSIHFDDLLVSDTTSTIYFCKVFCILLMAVNRYADLPFWVEYDLGQEVDN